MTHWSHARAGAAACALAGLLVVAQAGATPATPPTVPVAASPATATPDVATTATGREVFERFREGLADPECVADASTRWRRHFAHVPDDLARKPERLLPLFGYVVEALRASHLPTEYALIPFVESGYRPGARSPSGPAGLWQFIGVTARNHRIAIRPGYDGRLSPVDSTRAAVRYLRTLHGMFAGDWRLAVMGYNAGEYRVFGALKRAGQRAMDAEPETLAMPAITRAYVRKLQALSCLLVEAGNDEEWLRAIDRPVPVLTETALPAGSIRLDDWARARGLDPALVRHFNPVFSGVRRAHASDAQVLAPRTAYSAPTADATPAAGTPVAAATPPAAIDADAPVGDAAAPARSHTVARGESVWRIARRYGISSAQLLERNRLADADLLLPGMVLRIDPPPASVIDAAAAGRVAH